MPCRLRHYGFRRPTVAGQERSVSCLVFEKLEQCSLGKQAVKTVRTGVGGGEYVKGPSPTGFRQTAALTAAPMWCSARVHGVFNDVFFGKHSRAPTIGFIAVCASAKAATVGQGQRCVAVHHFLAKVYGVLLGLIIGDQLLINDGVTCHALA